MRPDRIIPSLGMAGIPMSPLPAGEKPERGYVPPDLRPVQGPGTPPGAGSTARRTDVARGARPRPPLLMDRDET
jgi:hypothetical protein